MGSDADHEAETGDMDVREAAAQLTDRDRDLLGLLCLARYLTATQVHRLAFDGRNASVASRRLQKLARAAGGQPAFVRQRFFRTYDGNRVGVWALAKHGMFAAQARAGALALPELPKHDVGAQFLEHLVRLNDVFVDLWRTGDRCPRAAHPAFRWIPSDRVRLEWGEWEVRQGRQQQRVILPDAVLELPAQKRRFFLECEMGTQTIVPGEGVEAPGATLSKAERYQRFLTGRTGDARVTHYGTRYPDGFTPQVLYLVQTSGRASSVNAALSAWQKWLDAGPLSNQKALTFEEATGALRLVVGLPASAPAAAKPAPPKPAKRRREVTSAEVRLLTGFVETALRRLNKVKALFKGEEAGPGETREVQRLLARLR
jgi:hypothetical protein